MSLNISSIFNAIKSYISNIFNDEIKNNHIKIDIKLTNSLPECIFAKIINNLGFDDIKSLCRYKYFYLKIMKNVYIWMKLCSEYLDLDINIIKQRYHRYGKWNDSTFEWKDLYIDLLNDMKYNKNIGYLPHYIKLFNL